MAAPPLRPDARFRRRPGILERECLDGFVVYDPATERIHVLNDAARFVWKRCEAASVAEMVAEASGTAGIAVEAAAVHVRDALHLLLDRELLDAC